MPKKKKNNSKKELNLNKEKEAEKNDKKVIDDVAGGSENIEKNSFSKIDDFLMADGDGHMLEIAPGQKPVISESLEREVADAPAVSNEKIDALKYAPLASGYLLNSENPVNAGIYETTDPEARVIGNISGEREDEFKIGFHNPELESVREDYTQRVIEEYKNPEFHAQSAEIDRTIPGQRRKGRL